MIKFEKVCFMIANLKRDFFSRVPAAVEMDWIRRNLIFFNSKKSKKTSEPNEKDVVMFDDEFIDITGEQELATESPDHAACEPQNNKPAADKKVARKPLNHQIVCLSEAAPCHDTSSDIEPIKFAAPPQKPKNFKKKNGNGQQQVNTQLRNNIIHQPR